MPSFDFKKYLPQLLVIAGFAALSLLFCYPQLEGKVLNQGDVVSWRGASHEASQYYEKTGENTLWSNSMFGGMPTYTFFLPKTNNYVAKIHLFIIDIFGKPACFFFIAMLCCYILFRVLRINNWLAVAGAIAYAFSSYNTTIIVNGHETKMFALAYFPAVIAGLLLIYRSKIWQGIPLLGISLSLMIATGHYQILYYAIIVVLFAVAGMFVIAFREKKLKQFFIASAAALITAVISIGPNLPVILPTIEYNKETMRGGQSELTINKHDQGKKNGGLDKDYAFRWSNGIDETFDLMIPYLHGGSSNEPIEVAEKSNELVGGQASQLPVYWGPQPFILGPIYMGAIICFLFILGLLVVRSPHKWWIVTVSILSIAMSWGNHFAAFNYFLFDTLPMMNKFRSPSTVLVIAELFFPVLGIWGLNEIITGSQDKNELLKKLKIAAGITAGICIILAFGGNMFFDYKSASDARLPEQLLPALREDRASIAMKSSLTSAVYILLAAGLIWAYLKSKISNVNIVILGVSLLIVIDLLSVSSRYLNKDSFVDADEYKSQFQPRPVDEQIMQDKDPYYRVLDISKDVYNDAIQAYFHKCVGGYSPAKMERYQDLIDVHMNGKFNAQVLNMLNTKYIIFQPGSKGAPTAMANPDACGNAWFVNDVKWARTADEEILSLNAHSLGDSAKQGEFDPKKTAVMRENFRNEMGNYNFGKDSSATVKLTRYGLNDLSYVSNNNKNGLAIFSDMYYPYGWEAYVDGKETPIMKADYVLRAIKIPAGQHKIDFKFHPKSFYKGNTLAMISSILLYLMLGISIFQLIRKKTETSSE
jgi:hypothetical protein